jgi:hypothetical protein
MGNVSARPRRRKHNFDRNAMRRGEIVRFAGYIGAMATDDRYRWLVAWLWHCPKAEDRAWSVRHAFEQMNRRLTVLPTGNSAP